MYRAREVQRKKSLSEDRLKELFARHHASEWNPNQKLYLHELKIIQVTAIDLFADYRHYPEPSIVETMLKLKIPFDGEIKGRDGNSKLKLYDYLKSWWTKPSPQEKELLEKVRKASTPSK